MVSTKTVLCGVWLTGFWLSAPSAQAGGEAGHWSLRMRPATSAHGSAHAARRTSQAAPDPAPDVDLDDGDADIPDPPIVPPGLVTPPAPPVVEQCNTRGREPDDDADDRAVARA